jgi:hypothetical protein
MSHHQQIMSWFMRADRRLCMLFVLQHEAKWTEQAIKFFNEAAAQTGSSQAAADSSQQQQDGALLYDLVFEKALDHRSPACSRVHR